MPKKNVSVYPIKQFLFPPPPLFLPNIITGDEFADSQFPKCIIDWGNIFKTPIFPLKSAFPPPLAKRAVTEPEQIKALHVIVSWHVILPVAPSIVIRFEPQVAKETFLPEVDPQLVWNDKSLFGTLWCIRISRPDNLNPLKKV